VRSNWQPARDSGAVRDESELDHAHALTLAYTDTHEYRDGSAIADVYADQKCNAQADYEPDRDGDAYSDADCDAYADGHGDGYANADSHADDEPDAVPQPNPDRDSGLWIVPGGGRRRSVGCRYAPGGQLQDGAAAG
jgi:hypothetical protein